MKLDPVSTHHIRRVVELHLEMVKTSQRRDLDDLEVITQFSRVVENETALDLLALHTFADSMGTSDTLWNGFKDSLLWQLYHKASAMLRGDTEIVKAERRKLEILRENVRRLLPKDFDPEELYLMEAVFGEHLRARLGDEIRAWVITIDNRVVACAADKRSGRPMRSGYAPWSAGLTCMTFTPRFYGFWGWTT